jgi:hypothetical protein
MFIVHTVQGFNDCLNLLQQRGDKPRLYRLYDKLVVDDGDDDDVFHIDYVDGCWIHIDRKLLTEEVDVDHARSLIVQQFQLPDTDVMNMFRDRLANLTANYQGQKCEMDILCSHEEHIQMVMYLYFNLYSLPDSVPIPGGIRFEWDWLYKY